MVIVCGWMSREATQQQQQRQQQQQNYYYGETAMNMCLLDPVRYGWTACGGVANIVSQQHVYTKQPGPKLSLSVVVEFPLEPVPPRRRPSSSKSSTTTTTATATTAKSRKVAICYIN